MEGWLVRDQAEKGGG